MKRNININKVNSNKTPNVRRYTDEEALVKVKNLVGEYNDGLALLDKFDSGSTNCDKLKQEVKKRLETIKKKTNEIIRKKPDILNKIKIDSVPFDIDTREVFDTFEGDVFSDNSDFINKSKALAQELREIKKEKGNHVVSVGSELLARKDNAINDTCCCCSCKEDKTLQLQLNKKVLEKNITIREEGENIKFSVYDMSGDISVEYTMKKSEVRITYENGTLIVEKYDTTNKK